MRLTLLGSMLAVAVAGSALFAAARPADPPRVRTKATVDDVDYELLACTRKGSKVTFTFSMLCDKGDRLMYGGGATPYGLILTTGDGAKVTPTLTEGPTARIQLKKGFPSKFQVIISGVDEDVTEFAEVVLHRGYGGPDEDVHFYNIKITKK